MSAPPRVWLLNLDADAELATRGHYTPAKRMKAKVATLQPKVMSLLGPSDMTLQQWTSAWAHSARRPSPSPRGFAWCPTPRAVEQLSDAGVLSPLAPSMEVLRRVNHRAFCQGLGPTLDGAAFVTSGAQLAGVMNAQQPALGWLLKRPSVPAAAVAVVSCISTRAMKGGWLPPGATAASWRNLSYSGGWMCRCTVTSVVRVN